MATARNRYPPIHATVVLRQSAPLETIRRERIYSDEKMRVNATIAFFLHLSIMELCSQV